jgi:hypothetical protein
MLLVNPWDKAAECARAIKVTADPERRVVLHSLRILWIALGNKQACSEGAELAGQLSTITQIHAELMSACRNAMH